MRFAIISDIHGNYKALEAFLEYVGRNPADGIICLGDMVTDSPYPERTIAMVHEMERLYSCYLVRGNREQYLIDNFHRPQGFKPSSANGSLYYTAQRVTPEDIRFFESLPATMRLPAEDCPATRLCHGAPDDLRGNFMENPELLPPVLQALKEEYLFGGHSHDQGSRSINGKTYVNPGSLGLAVDGVGKRAQFAEAECAGDGWRIVFHSIPYDTESYLADFGASGLDAVGGVLNRAVKMTLRTGVNYFFETVRDAVQSTGKNPPDIPEEVWERIAVEKGF